MLMAAGTAGSANLRAFDSALPQLAESLGVTLGQTGHFTAAYALAYGLSQLPFGLLGDRMDKLKLVRLLAALSALVMLATALAASYPAMLGLRLVAGAASSAVIPLTISYIGDTVPFARRQIVLAWNMTALTAGVILGQAAGGMIAGFIDWHAIPVFVALLYLPAVLGLRGESTGAGAPARRAMRPAEALRAVFARPFSRAILSGAFLEGAFIFSASAFCGMSLAVRFDLSVGAVGLLLTIYALGSISNVALLRRWPEHWGMRGHFTLGGALAALGLLSFALAPACRWRWWGSSSPGSARRRCTTTSRPSPRSSCPKAAPPGLPASPRRSSCRNRWAARCCRCWSIIRAWRECSCGAFCPSPS